MCTVDILNVLQQIFYELQILVTLSSISITLFGGSEAAILNTKTFTESRLRL
jgi:hypothetical protein